MNKSCLVIRHGALGDHILASAVLPYLQNDGYDITFYTNERGMTVLENNPRISHFLDFIDGTIPLFELEEHYQSMGKDYDKVVNLTGTVENELLFTYPQPLYWRPLRERRKEVNDRNYFDAQVERAGYKPNTPNPEIYFSKEEEEKGKSWAKKHSGYFKIVWALAGSSVHKIARYFESTAREFLSNHKDSLLFTAGNYITKLLTYQHPRVYNTMFWEMSFRETMLLTKYADLVIGPETGALLAAAAFDTPKLCLLTHSSRENLTKHWKNDFSLQAPVYCSPCHLLHKYTYIWRNVCQVGTLNLPLCTEHGKGDILERMEKIYEIWKDGKQKASWKAAA